jgi:hypothetical protein
VRRHPFDPISAALGILAVTAGLLVALGEVADVDTGGPWWAAAAAGLIGLAIIPWRRGAGGGGTDGPADLLVDVPADMPVAVPASDPVEDA